MVNIIVEYAQSAFKRHISETDIENAILTAECFPWFPPKPADLWV